jgi:hypothetical protein
MDVTVAVDRRSRTPISRGVAMLVALSLSATLASCITPVPPDTDPSIRGVITEVTPGEDGGVVLVVWHDSLGEVYDLDSIAASIDENTEVFDREGNLIEFADLEVRDVVDAWVTGPIAESYPPQGRADALRVIGEFDEMRPLPIPPGLVSP